MANEERYSAQNTKIAYAIGPADLTQWDNAQAALIVSELNSLDQYQGGVITPTFPITQKVGTLPAASPQNRVQTGRVQGKYNLQFLLQTGILSYFIFGACTTTEATPNIHAITASAGQDPIRFGFHAEAEVTTNARRRDLLGHVPESLVISCAEGQMAKQNIGGKYAYANMAAADLEVPAVLDNVTYRPYRWVDLIAGGTSDVIDFFYAVTGEIGVDIIGVTQNFTRNGGLYQKDSSDYPQTGKFIGPFMFEVTLTVVPKDLGVDISTIMNTIHTSYAGDLDLVLNYYDTASRYLQFTYDKMYIDPGDEKAVTYDEWHQTYDITLSALSSSSSCVIEEKNALNNDYYENPA